MIQKFRAWLKSVGEMVEVLEIDFYNKEAAYIWTEQISDYELEQTREVDKLKDVILMQSTGSKDKNGVEIFEGDIVKRSRLFDGAFIITHIGEVVYDKEYTRYVIRRPQKNAETKIEELRNTLSDKSTYEVIGNIWENPELLEVVE